MAESSLVVQVLCSALNSAPGFKSCAHLADCVREACDEYSASPELRAEIENELGVSITPISARRRRQLKREDLL